MGWLPSVLLAATVTLLTRVESKHVGCYYGVWAYTRSDRARDHSAKVFTCFPFLDLEMESSGRRILT